MEQEILTQPPLAEVQANEERQGKPIAKLRATIWKTSRRPEVIQIVLRSKFEFCRRWTIRLCSSVTEWSEESIFMPRIHVTSRWKGKLCKRVDRKRCTIRPCLGHKSLKNTRKIQRWSWSSIFYSKVKPLLGLESWTGLKRTSERQCRSKKKKELRGNPLQRRDQYWNLHQQAIGTFFRWPGRWSPQGRSRAGGGGLARVPNLRVCKHPKFQGWHTQREKGEWTSCCGTVWSAWQKPPVRRKGGRAGVPKRVSGRHVVRGRQSSPILEVRQGNKQGWWKRSTWAAAHPGQDRRLPVWWHTQGCSKRPALDLGWGSSSKTAPLSLSTGSPAGRTPPHGHGSMYSQANVRPGKSCGSQSERCRPWHWKGVVGSGMGQFFLTSRRVCFGWKGDRSWVRLVTVQQPARRPQDHKREQRKWIDKDPCCFQMSRFITQSLRYKEVGSRRRCRSSLWSNCWEMHGSSMRGFKILVRRSTRKFKHASALVSGEVDRRSV